MKRRLSQWMLFTGIVSVSAILTIMLFERAATVAVDPVLAPWFAFCSAITPLSWQVRGNILLGMMWTLSGVIVYSMLISAAGVGLSSVMEKLRRPGKRHDKVSD